MYEPELQLRLEIEHTDIDDHWAWHLITGGQQRGGLALHHGYLIVPSVFIEEDFDEMVNAFRGELIRHCLRWQTQGVQLQLRP